MLDEIRIANRRALGSIVAVALIVTVGFASLARAQLDPGEFIILQGDRVAGRVFVEGGQDQCRYFEHWYLLPGYVYPNAGNRATFTVEPAPEATFKDLAEFLRVMRQQAPGGTHVEIAVVERRAGCK